MKTVWQIGIERIAVKGVAGAGLDSAALSPAIERAVAAAVKDAALPAGRCATAVVEVRAAPLSGREPIAAAVADGVVHALRGGPPRG